MHYIVYKTTNLINNKFYIGVHKTKNLNDKYLGSGEYLLNAIKKYGVKNFKREILFELNNEEETFNKEKEIITEEFIKNNKGKIYNLKAGGYGGSGFRNRKHSKKSIDKMRKSKIGEKNSFFNKHHSQETKKKMSESHQNVFGKNNPSYGTCWIFNYENKKNLRIKKSDIDLYLKHGWTKGRKFNW